MNNEINLYVKKDIYPFHMPGHKGNMDFINPNILKHDFTEIDGFDNLHNANGIIANLQKRIALIYNASESFILVNGSSSGILASINAIATNKTILVARNCHISVINACILSGAKPIYVYPNINKYGFSDGIKANQIKEILEQPNDIEAVFMTSPSYEGNVSEIEEIAKITNKYGKILIVDEAHGAHFALNKAFPTSATNYADIVINSFHKTLPTFTQSAVLHFGKNNILSNKQKENIKNNLRFFQTTSPSYIFLSQIDYFFNIYEENFYSHYIENLLSIRKKIKNIIKTDDLSKIIISHKNNIDLLKQKYKIEFELATNSYIIAISTIADNNDGFERLIAFSQELDDIVEFENFAINQVIQILSPQEAYYSKKQLIQTNQALNKICGENVYITPPCIPILIQGEQITEQHIEILNKLNKKAIEIIMR